MSETNMLATGEFEKGRFVRRCLTEHPEMKIRDIQYKTQEYGYTISAAYISETRKAFFAEQANLANDGASTQADEPLTGSAQALA